MIAAVNTIPIHPIFTITIFSLSSNFLNIQFLLDGSQLFEEQLSQSNSFRKHINKMNFSLQEIMGNFSLNLTWKIFLRRTEPRFSQISNPTYFDVHLFCPCSGHLVGKVNGIAAIRKRFIDSFYLLEFQKICLSSQVSG